MKFEYKTHYKIKFYWNYFYRKIFTLWIEVKTPKLKFFIYEVLYSLSKFIDKKHLLKSPFKNNYIETIFGKFKIRPHTTDILTVSPAYERDDIEYLLKLFKKLLNKNKKLLFVDIGAYIGMYSIVIGNKFKNFHEKTKILSIEPSVSNFLLLSENIKLNSLEKIVDLQNVAISEEDYKKNFFYNFNAPGTSGFYTKNKFSETVETKNLASLLLNYKDYDVFIIKIDVEGYEKEVLKSMKSVLEWHGKEFYFLIEDFIKLEIVDYLNLNHFDFLTKITPYNSWWYKKCI